MNSRYHKSVLQMAIYVSLAFFGGHCYAGEQSGGLVFESEEYEFSSFSFEAIFESVIAFENKGGQPVTITEVLTDCGCLVSSLKKNTYKPGEKGILSFKLNTYNSPGNYSRLINVVSSAGKVDIPVSVSVISPILTDTRILKVSGSDAISVEFQNNYSTACQLVSIEMMKGDAAIILPKGDLVLPGKALTINFQFPEDPGVLSFAGLQFDFGNGLTHTERLYFQRRQSSP